MFAKKGKAILIALCVSVGALTISTAAQAEPIDAYRDMIVRKTYTIKYQNITPETRQTNRNRVIMMNGTMDDPMSAMYVPTQSIVVSDGSNRYEESGYGPYVTCRLQRGEEMYNFSRVTVGNKTNYVGTVGGKAKKGATAATRYAMMYMAATQGLQFGDNQMTRFLNALLPNQMKPEGATTYSRVASGTLPNGLSYVDYKADQASHDSFEAIRYYFQGNQMVKIASGQYYVNDRGELDGVRYIIKIDEFTATPDPSYLKLPDGLEDKTKRDKDGKSAEGK